VPLMLVALCFTAHHGILGELSQELLAAATNYAPTLLCAPTSQLDSPEPEHFRGA